LVRENGEKEARWEGDFPKFLGILGEEVREGMEKNDDDGRVVCRTFTLRLLGQLLGEPFTRAWK
jgi:hypothetical protein